MLYLLDLSFGYIFLPTSSFNEISLIMASLFLFLDEQFKEKAQKRKSEIDFSIPTSHKIKDSIFEGNDYYLIGPWIILEYLRDYETNFEEEVILNIIKQLENKEPIPIETILYVIKKALEISPIEFLYFIEKYFEEGFIPLI